MEPTEGDRSYWKPSRGLDFQRVRVAADNGRIRTTCEVFARHNPTAEAADQVQLTLHKQQAFAAVVHLGMSVEDALAVYGVLGAALQDALDARHGPDAPSPWQLVSPFKVVAAQEVR
ncbi:hypothetical protein [Nocardia terpenica]|uniref:Uncharacterized protein n=1 Tax=Nocardia terpenica TaxID=455432 RepID=A0A6G9Z0U5_9NOCA|nr:hypothetical protein [Nocardia terpenica]QIS19215.1 hypothetical protein F6W96_13860 [Nocardia terpenica]